MIIACCCYPIWKKNRVLWQFGVSFSVSPSGFAQRRPLNGIGVKDSSSESEEEVKRGGGHQDMLRVGYARMSDYGAANPLKRRANCCMFRNTAVLQWLMSAGRSILWRYLPSLRPRNASRPEEDTLKNSAQENLWKLKTSAATSRPTKRAGLNNIIIFVVRAVAPLISLLHWRCAMPGSLSVSCNKSGIRLQRQRYCCSPTSPEFARSCFIRISDAVFSSQHQRLFSFRRFNL